MKNRLEVVMDGVIYQMQSTGGISRLYNEILPRMCESDESLHITLLTSGHLKQSLPTHSQISHRRFPSIAKFLRPGRLWMPVTPRVTALVQRLWVGGTKGRIWHSTYYTVQECWDGPSVATVVDTIQEHFPDLFDRPGHRRLREQKRRCILRADAVICISETTRKDILHFYEIDPAKTRVVPLAHSDVFRQLCSSEHLAKPPTDRPFLLYIGSRSHYKNFDSLLRAYSIWPGRKETSLVIVGNSWSAEEQQRLAELQIRDRMILLEAVSDDYLCHLYNQAAAFVYPSLYEGFGIPLLEAMACGCPVVASHIPSTVEVAGECPFYFEPTVAEELLIAIDDALSEGRNSERVRKGLERVRRYSWDKTAAKTVDVYRSLLGM